MEMTLRKHMKSVLTEAIKLTTCNNNIYIAMNEMKSKFGNKIICTYCLFSNQGEFFSYDNLDYAPEEGYMRIGKRKLNLKDLKQIASKTKNDYICYIERNYDDSGWEYRYFSFEEFTNSIY